MITSCFESGIALATPGSLRLLHEGKIGDLLIWVGFTSDQMQRQLELDQAFPSFFLSEKDLNLRAVKPYRPRVGYHEPLYDELCIIADEERALIRRGDISRKVSLADASELFSALLARYLDDLPA